MFIFRSNSFQTTSKRMMIHPSPVFVAFLAAARFAGVASFAAVPLRLSSPPSSSMLAGRHDAHRESFSFSQAAPPMGSTQAAHPVHINAGIAGAGKTVSMPHRAARWRSRLGASGETLGGEGKEASPAEESGSAAGGEGGVDASAAPTTAGGAGVDLAKGIAFEAPKPKALEPEQEEESESKKVGPCHLARLTRKCVMTVPSGWVHDTRHTTFCQFGNTWLLVFDLRDLTEILLLSRKDLQDPQRLLHVSTPIQLFVPKQTTLCC